MKIAVISDIHGNYDALEATLKDIEAQKVDKIVCLGDFVDYGPESERISEKIQDLNIPTVIGNHEYALFDDDTLQLFASIAYRSTLLTRRMVSDKTYRFVRSLPTSLTIEGLRFVHGSPPDNPHDYIYDLTPRELRERMQSIPESISFVGHTHLAGIFEDDATEISVQQLKPGIMQLKPTNRYIINVGSIGQPREPNKDAKYVIFDTKNYILETRYVKYDPRRTAKLILELGFPTECAIRILPLEYRDLIIKYSKGDY